ncbi:MAG: formate dehydrogenase accessory protein FdhE [Candidatus Bathyarchaeota archaeon]|nr:formate dehydrogenase accessory protein FdhE [Candidatus Bathyarchaeota archaeon]
MESILTEIEEFKKRRPTFEKEIKIYKMMLQAQKPILEKPKAGTYIDRMPVKFLDKLQNLSLKDGKPLSSLLEPTIYDFKTLNKTFLATLEGFEKLNIEKSKKYLKLIDNMSKPIPEFIEKRLKNDHKFFLSLEKKFDLRNSFLEMIVDTLIQPSMKMFASKVKKEEFLDLWNKTICPICGRIPFIVVKDEEEVWRFQCAFCNAEYAMNIFRCPNCENEDFKRKGFFFVEGREAFEVSYCQDCSSYFKVINKHKLREGIPIGLEDLHTSFLDELAQKKNLKRLDTLRLRTRIKNQQIKR